ncbi:uncharacterized protein F5147DRAFT_748223 [Suillus discolor]|uniref:Uncharacterized protein n=1 Tax=Suillus discolor TaxID=1912936 RepID=A0A9P7JMX6_9AGAM|nr:uncharacterized protein F5147DRAFT_748223 [Suillus discolor]KAG2090483.1 hypothetical protein F5147DRAFT_748223 [Suillus discolor]
MGELKDLIREMEPQLQSISQSHLHSYSISEDEDDLRETLDTLNAGHLLVVTHKKAIFEYFIGVPVLEPLYLVVQVYSDMNRSTNPPLCVKHVIDEEDLIKIARQSFLENIDNYSKKKKSKSKLKRSHSPSNALHPSSFSCGHPHELKETIPATLLHPVFGQFMDDSWTHTTTEDDNNLVHELGNVMSAFYETESKRVDAVSVVLTRYSPGFHLNSKVQGTAYITDADMSIDIHNHHHPYVIAEFKNEAATSNSEPYIQALSYYLESTRMSVLRMSGSSLPCFLLILFGPYIVFAGAVWTLHPAVQILSNPLAFNYCSTDMDNKITAAHHMAAFSKAVRSLEKYYETLPPESKLANTLYHSIIFPYPTTFTSLDENSTTVFSYTEHLEEEKAKTLTGGHVEVPICIKFIRCYSQKAYLRCALLGLPGGWLMVVMDRLVAYNVLADLPHIVHLPQSVFEAIRKELKTLHARKLVHGDMHDTNILVKTNDQTKFMIIDFDWVGVEEVVQYLPYINYTDIKKPKDVRDELPIKVAHDIVMIDFIINTRVQK